MRVAYERGEFRETRRRCNGCLRRLNHTQTVNIRTRRCSRSNGSQRVVMAGGSTHACDAALRF